MPQPPAKRFSGIFLSYRRDDSSGHAGRLSDRLIDRFGEERIFMDIDNIEPGEDFVEVIQNAVSSCDVLIAMIGRHWLLSPDDDGRPRLNNPNDFVRLEIAAALRQDIRVIPVLVHKATMPKPPELPKVLRKLTRLHAVELSDNHWQRDVDELISSLERILDKAKVKVSLPEPAPDRSQPAKSEVPLVKMPEHLDLSKTVTKELPKKNEPESNPPKKEQPKLPADFVFNKLDFRKLIASGPPKQEEPKPSTKQEPLRKPTEGLDFSKILKKEPLKKEEPKPRVTDRADLLLRSLKRIEPPKTEEPKPKATDRADLLLRSLKKIEPPKTEEPKPKLPDRADLKLNWPQKKETPKLPRDFGLVKRTDFRKLIGSEPPKKEEPKLDPLRMLGPPGGVKSGIGAWRDAVDPVLFSCKAVKRFVFWSHTNCEFIVRASGVEFVDKENPKHSFRVPVANLQTASLTNPALSVGGDLKLILRDGTEQVIGLEAVDPKKVLDEVLKIIKTK